ncbi:TPA: hypothetical protein QHC09_005493 [Klebsiella pneumoniae subsp. pneumoniae]|nr:hypothetical protein [Klebsiella pneumoniae subsp. pneumoniae]HDT5929629.1 hypothetical protein [Klebsiella pneumoniae subsp. pneumoniae]HDT6023212.1 hypothetical protein [Klebsiella pneumoniae subsp. pneumoniae]HDT6059085.1 hypothetical protein [Klebsiella pneumoniae subsp. pneumoniae]
MIEECDFGFIWGHTGFYDFYVNEDDNGQFLVGYLTYDGENGYVFSVSIEWFNNYKHEMISKYPNEYNGVNYKKFMQMVKKYLQ